MTTTLQPLEIAAVSDREVRVTRRFAAPRALVFDAMTRRDFIMRWLWGPDDWRITRCDVDLKVGGALRYEWSNPDKGTMGLSGVFTEIDPPARVVHTELFDEDWTGGEAVVAMDFEERGDATEMVMTILYSSKEARDAVLKTPMADGMEAGYRRLDDLLGVQGRELNLTREFDAPRDLVWKAWSTEELVKRWFCPDMFTIPEANIDFRPGGVSEVCMRAPDGSDHWSRGRYEKIDEPERIVTVGSVAGDDGLALFEARTTVRFEAKGDKTVVHVHQAYTVFEPRARAALEGASIGWGQSLDKLERLLAEESSDSA